MDDMFFATGSDIPVERFIAPRVEVETGVRIALAVDGTRVTSSTF